MVSNMAGYFVNGEPACACGHLYGVHLPSTNTCAGEAAFLNPGDQWNTACGCRGFALNSFEIRPVDGNKLSQVICNGIDVTALLSAAEVFDHDDEHPTWQLRLALRPDANTLAPDAVRMLTRAASAYPPYVSVTPEKMAAGQWVVRLGD
jgi:hypothetical protein